MHFGPDKILLVIEIDMIDDLSLAQAEKTMDSLRLEIKNKESSINQVYLQTTNKLPENKLGEN
jgi:hypothetical protein